VNIFKWRFEALFTAATSIVFCKISDWGWLEWFCGSSQSCEFLEIIAMINLRLVNEYLSPSLFFPDLEKMGHIDIDDLPISRGLKDELFLWDKEYQATFNDDYPPDSGFSSIEDEIRHKNVGVMLAKKNAKGA
jgi:hypothetical protein